ncbi:MAG: hypothetical protein AAB903_00275 [Patescibacteria group bacterium]
MSRASHKSSDVSRHQRPGGGFSSEKALLLAVLNEAFTDLRRRNKEVQKEAEAWFTSDARYCTYGWSFVYIMEIFGIEPGVARACILQTHPKFRQAEKILAKLSSQGEDQISQEVASIDFDDAERSFEAELEEDDVA